MKKSALWIVAYALLAAFVSGCGAPLRRHAMSPYSTNAAQATALEQEAAKLCASWGKKVPPRTFKVDGCSLFLDGTWGECCKAHDIEYWCGGSYLDRLRADIRLGACVFKKGPPVIGQFLAFVMPPFVQLGGMKAIPSWFRWDYGTPSRLECYFENENGCPEKPS